MWWEGMVMLSHHHHNMEHCIDVQNMLMSVYVPMNNTFSLCPQVSDIVLSQYDPRSLVLESRFYYYNITTSRKVGFTSRHRTSSSSMFSFHTNNNGREEGCYVWWSH